MLNATFDYCIEVDAAKTTVQKTAKRAKLI